MDWIQIYLACVLGLDFLINVHLLGKGETITTTPSERLLFMIIGIPFSIPYVGRVFGWW